MKLNGYDLFIEFNKYHEPNFTDGFYDIVSFCNYISCSFCRIKSKCPGSLTDGRYLNRDELAKVKNEFPEYFI